MSPLLPVGLLLAAAQAPVTVETLDGRQWWSVHATDASLEGLLTRIARRSGRELEGFDTLRRGALVTIELERRPLEQVLEYVLGSVGLGYELRTNAVRIVDDSPELLEGEALLDRATRGWVRATTRFPGHPFAPDARLAQGELAELRGEPVPALAHYQALVEEHPEADEVAEATMRSGRVLQDLGRWAEASRQFRKLTMLAADAEYHAPARLELARCSIELGDAQSAIHVLASLDATYPTTDATERTGREIVRANALQAIGRSMEALRVLDGVQVDLDPLGRRVALRVRATALEGVGLPGDAARAWVLYGSESRSRAERGNAYREAARLSLEAGDELGALFVCRTAEAEGIEQKELGPFLREARRRLGLEEATAHEPSDLAARIENAERSLDAGDAAAAAGVLEPLFSARGALEPPLAARIVVAWARCVEAREGVEAATELLADERQAFDGQDTRAVLDAAAGRMLERHGLFERAIEAYQGRLRPEDGR